MSDTLVRDFTSALHAFGSEVNELGTLAFREVALVTAEAIDIGNEFGPGVPLDTGYLRASFRVGINQVNDGPSERPRVKGRKPGDAPLTSATVDTSPVTRVALGDSVYITTNVEYAEPLENNPKTRRNGPPENRGASTEFIAPVEARFERIVDDAAQRVGYGR